MATEQRQFELRRSAREGQKAQFLEQVDQLRQQIIGNDEQVAAKSKEIDFEPAGAHRHPRAVEAEPRAVQPGDDPGARFGAHARRARRAGGSIAQAKGRIAEIQLKILQIDEDLRTEVGKDLGEIRAKRPR